MTYFAEDQLLNNNRYQIIEKIGQGGFGVTYLTQDLNLEREVVIKTLNIDNLKLEYKKDNSSKTTGFDAYLDNIQRKFIKEAQTLVKFNHPHIVTVYDLFEEKIAKTNVSIWCMVMQYIKGKDLAQYLAENGVLPEAKAVEIIVKIGKALGYVHSKGSDPSKCYLHRDVKPHNILLRQEDAEIERLFKQPPGTPLSKEGPRGYPL